MIGTMPPETFRISAAPLFSWPFFVVHIAASVEAMREIMRDHSGGCHPAQLGAVIGVADPNPDGPYTACAGIVYLSEDRVGAGLVAHELGHAAFRLCERVGLTIRHWDRGASLETNPSEETYCDVLERLTRDFWRQYYAHGFGQP